MQIKLYEIAEKLRQLDFLLESNGGEVTPEAQTLQDQIDHELEAKTDNCIAYMEDLKDWIKIAKERKTKLEADIKAKEGAISRYESYIIECLKRSKKSQFSGSLYSLKAKKPAKKVQITDENKIPVEFISYERVKKISKKEITEKLKNNEEVPGAEFVKGKESLTIKRL